MIEHYFSHENLAILKEWKQQSNHFQIKKSLSLVTESLYTIAM